VVRLGFIIGFIALIGVLLSGLAAYRVHDQELTVDRIAMARAIDVHASLVQDRLTERELLARVASGLFRAPAVVKANMLQPLRSSIYAFKTDFVIASWIARLNSNELDAACAELKSAGFSNPKIRNYDDKPLDTRSLDKPIDVLMDVEPRTAATMAFPGRSLDQQPILGVMLAQAMADGKPVASDPIRLLGADGPIGLVLAAPVLQEGEARPAGFVTFSYELASLMLANIAMAPLGGLLALYLTGTTFSVSSGVGFLALFGVCRWCIVILLPFGGRIFHNIISFPNAISESVSLAPGMCYRGNGIVRI